MERIFKKIIFLLCVISVVLASGVNTMSYGKSNTSREEVLIICGPSTVAGLAGIKSVDDKGNEWKVNYKEKYGCNIEFVCKSGAGIKFFDSNASYVYEGVELLAKTPSDDKNVNLDGTGDKQLRAKIKNANKNQHLTIAFVCSANDLKKSFSKENGEDICKNIAQFSIDYVKKLAKEYPQCEFVVFPATPIDEQRVSDEYLKKNAYNVSNSNNLKRYAFACALNRGIDNNEIANFKYSDGAFKYFFRNGSKSSIKLGGITPTGKGKYSCYDGKHYTAEGCEIVMDYILRKCDLK